MIAINVDSIMLIMTFRQQFYLDLSLKIC
jgi:hypothetical protein